MASLKIDPRSRYWYACITRHDGRQTQVSTKLRRDEVSRAKAQIYADTLEKAYRVKRASDQYRKHMLEAWLAIRPPGPGEWVPGNRAAGDPVEEEVFSAQ